MYTFIKKFLKQKEPEKCILSFDAIPAWLTQQEKISRSAFENETEAPVRNIRNATAQLQLIVNGIADAEHDPAIHPKLKSIAKNSLPLFVKAMNSSLSKELPDDIEEFYSAAVECVKGCLNSTRGQGRYLQVVFPEEMKAVKTGIDAIGRELNAITASLTRYRKTKTLVQSIRSLHDAIRDIRTDSEKSLEKSQRIAARIVESGQRISVIEEELRVLPSDPKMTEVNEKKSALNAMEKRQSEIARTYATLSMTVSHVFRKAEKIATKQRHPPEIATLRFAIDLLSDHTVPDTKDLESALNKAFPIVQRMIAAEEIVLKNKEERAVFSDTGRFCTEICTTASEITTQDLACRNLTEAIASHPVLMKINSLEREKTQLESMLEKERQAQKELFDWIVKIKEKVPALQQELHQKIAEIIGENVQLQIDYPLLE
ncbi:MAG: hypothetical protein LUQ54_00690 [Methanoregula sp.]|nr:hypothetical protein [Methanoregula sp.]